MRRINEPLWALLLLALAPLGACGGGGSSSPTQASPPPSSSSVNVAGSWRGAASDSSGPGQIALQITQTGTALSGTATITLTGVTVSGHGTLTGTLSGTAIHLTIAVPAGGFDAPYASCSSNVSGDGQASATSITAAYTGTNSCSGEIAAGQLTLSKE